MNITKYAIEKSRVIIVLLLIIILGGLAAYFASPRAEDPGFTIRTAVVQTYYPGAKPEHVENLVTDKLEKVIQEMPEIDYIKSESRTGISVIYVYIKEEYKNIRTIWDKLRRKVEKATIDLPNGASKPFVNDEFGDVFGSLISLSADGYTYKELKDIADDARDELLRLPNVAKVEIHGTREETVFLEYNNALLADLDLSPAQLKGILESQNIIFSGGSIKIRDERITIEPSGNFESVKDIEKTVIKIPGQKSVFFLGDIVKVKRSYKEPVGEIAHSSGKNALLIAVSLKDGGNIIELGDELNGALSKFRSSYPIGVDFDVVSYQPEYVQDLIGGFVENLVQSVAIVIILMLVSLGFRVGLLVASLIPISILMTFLIMFNVNIGIDKISLTALIIALGMLVDNAIVMSESIMVKMQEGKKSLEAIYESAAELKKPLLIATLATSSAFLPIYLAESTVGEFCSSLFKVVTITLLCSWVLALTMIPMFCHYFLKLKALNEDDAIYDKPSYKKYRNVLISLLKRPYRTLLSVGLLFIFGLFLFGFVPKTFFPDSDRAALIIEATLPPESDITKTEKVISQIEDHIKKQYKIDKDHKDGITNWFSFAGKGAPRFVLSYVPESPNSNFGTIIVNTSSRFVVDRYIREIRDYMNSTFPDVNTVVKKIPIGPPADYPVELIISGKDQKTLFDIADRVKEQLRNKQGVTLVTDNWGAKEKKIIVDIDPVRAQRAGVTNKDIAISLQSAFSGLDVSQYRENDDVIPITLRATKTNQNKLDQIETINVYSQTTGKNVPLIQVANIKPVWQSAEILRRDRLKAITVQADIDASANAMAITQQLVTWLKTEEMKNWPIGYFYEVGGITEKAQEGNKSVNDKFPITILLIFLLLVIQFNSIRNTLAVLNVIPLPIFGVAVGLLVAHSYFGFITLLGLISLTGIVTNNSVVLIDRIEIEKQNYPDDIPRAILIAAQKRVRPILLTATTTIGGLLPLWLLSGPMFKPLAIAIIFGLIAACFVTLLILPVIYCRYYGINYKDFKY